MFLEVRKDPLDDRVESWFKIEAGGGGRAFRFSDAVFARIRLNLGEFAKLLEPVETNEFCELEGGFGASLRGAKSGLT